MQPLFDNAVVKIIPIEERTAGGLIIPSTVKDKSNQAKVIAIGPGSKDVPTSAKPGDTVLIPQGTGMEWEHEGEKLFILKENQILAIL